jgi:heavy metal translocating P-type ATPase
MPVEWWHNQSMGGFIRTYWFLLVAAIGLAAGFALQAAALPLYWVAWTGSAAVGLVLSLRWLIAAIRQKSFGSDALAVISILATAVTKEWIAAAVISLMLASGRALETWAEGRANSQLAALLARAPRTVHLLDSRDTVTTVGIDEVPVGSKILVKSGEVVPLDGTLVIAGTFDESALTGEPLPVTRAAGSEVASGVLNTDSGVELVTTQDSKTSTYAGLIRLVQQAQASSASSVRLANKWAVWFVPFSLLLAIATMLITRDYHNAVAVIVAATPCPLILAVPVAIIAGMSKAASKGAIIKGGAALELLARTKTILLDKTGTLTHGGPAISQVAVAPAFELNQVLAAAGSLEQDSPHVVAQAIVSRAVAAGLALTRATDVVETHGVGLSGTVSGVAISVGQPVEPLPTWAKLKHSLLVAVTINGELAGMFGLDDPVRQESKATLAALRHLGVERMILVSGDRRSTVEDVANEVGVDDFYAECSPEQKLLLLRAEQERTKGTVVAVGDGINDAPALAAAGVGVAMGARGATAASEAADVVIIEDSITHLAVAVDIAQGSRSRALQASGFGMGLAVLAMVLGSVGLLNATTAAISQEVIDAGAILWALVPATSRLPKPAKN